MKFIKEHIQPIHYNHLSFVFIQKNSVIDYDTHNTLRRLLFSLERYLVVMNI